MNIFTVKFANAEELVQVINKQAEAGFKLVTVQYDEDSYASFAPNEYFTPDQKLDQLLQKVDVMQKAVDDLVFGGGGL